MGGGEAAEGSQAHRRMVQDRDKADAARRWGVVWASARTWKTVEEQALKHLVPHGPHTYSQGPRGPREGRKGRQTFWPYSPCWCLPHGGDVTVVLRKKGRHLGPPPPKILGTNRAAWPPRQVGCLDQKRGALALRHWELQAGVGLGEPQGSGDTNRREQSVGSAGRADLLVLRVGHHASVPGTPWSIFQLQHALRLRAMTHQVAHQVKVQLGKPRKAT